MVFVMVLVAAATFLAIGAITAWMSLVGPQRRFAALPESFRSRRYTGLVADTVKTALMVAGKRAGVWVHRPRPLPRSHPAVCRLR